MKLAVFALLLATVAALPRPQRKIPGGGRIVGGMPAVEGQFPHQLMHRYYGSYICGAVIIDSKFALTAAHCVHEDGVTDPPAAVSLVAGKLSRTVAGPNEQIVQVTRIVAHADYDEYWFSNDIAIMYIGGGEFLNNNFIQAVPLPASQQQTHPGTITVSGWGTTSAGGQLAPTLMHVTIPTISDADCQRSYPDEQVLPSMLCAGLTQGGQDSCQGDSGGPLISTDSSQRTYLSGLVSWGYGCAAAGYPGVNTEVSYFIEWIEAQKQIILAEVAAEQNNTN